jgi:hypothetical protein
VLGRFPGRHEPVQNNGNHVPLVNEHGILVDLPKTVQKQIDPLVLRFRGRRDPEPYHFTHGLRDAVASGAKMSNDPGALVEAPVLGGARLGVPGIEAPHPIRQVYIQEDGHGIVKRHSPVRRLLHRDEAAGRFVRDSEGVPISGRQGSGLLPQRERQGWRILTRSNVNNTGGGDGPWIKDR